MKNTMGQRIKELRLGIGLSQEELAKMIGTTKQTVCKYESGVVTNIPLNRIKKMAEIFGADAAYVMGYDDEDQPVIDELAQVREVFSSLPADKQKQVLDYARFLLQEQGQNQ